MLADWIGRAGRASARLRPYAGRILGPALGAAGGGFGLVAGFILGLMLDRVAAARRRAAFLQGRASGLPAEEAAFLAAASLALRADLGGGQEPGAPSGGPERPSLRPLAPGPEALARRRGFLEAYSQADETAPREGARRLSARALPELLEQAAMEEDPDLPTLARGLADYGPAGERSRRALARSVYAETRLRGPSLDHETDRRIREMLADTGLRAEIVLIERARAFPDYRDPWQVLGLAPGSSPAEIKRAYRRQALSRHPDSGAAKADATGSDGPTDAAGLPAAGAKPLSTGGDEAERFRELRAAYEALSSPRAG